MQLYYVQLSGRAGRNGGQSLCVLYYNAKQKVKDTDLIKYCDDKDKENCRRVLLLKALGDTLRYSRDASKCCDRCNHEGIPVPHLSTITCRTKSQKKRSKRPPQANSDKAIEQLKEQLIKERNKIISNSPGLMWLGPDHVCNDRVISLYL